MSHRLIEYGAILTVKMDRVIGNICLRYALPVRASCIVSSILGIPGEALLSNPPHRAVHPVDSNHEIPHPALPMLVLERSASFRVEAYIVVDMARRCQSTSLQYETVRGSAEWGVDVSVLDDSAGIEACAKISAHLCPGQLMQKCTHRSDV